MSHFGRAGPPDIRDTYSLLVLNITFRTTPDDLFPHFERCGKVVDIFIPRDRRTGESRGFAFVRYKHADEAQKAIERLDGKNVDGRNIVVQFAKYGRNDESIQRGRITSSSPIWRSRSRSRSPRRGRRDYDDYRERERGRRRGRSRERFERERYREPVPYHRDQRRRAFSRSRSRSRSRGGGPHEYIHRERSRSFERNLTPLPPLPRQRRSPSPERRRKMSPPRGRHRVSSVPRSSSPVRGRTDSPAVRASISQRNVKSPMNGRIPPSQER